MSSAVKTPMRSKWSLPCPVCGRKVHYQKGPGWVHTDWYLGDRSVPSICDGAWVLLNEKACGDIHEHTPGFPHVCGLVKGHDGSHNGFKGTTWFYEEIPVQ